MLLFSLPFFWQLSLELLLQKHQQSFFSLHLCNLCWPFVLFVLKKKKELSFLKKKQNPKLTFSLGSCWCCFKLFLSRVARGRSGIECNLILPNFTGNCNERFILVFRSKWVSKNSFEALSLKYQVKESFYIAETMS